MCIHNFVFWAIFLSLKISKQSELVVLDHSFNIILSTYSVKNILVSTWIDFLNLLMY